MGVEKPDRLSFLPGILGKLFSERDSAGGVAAAMYVEWGKNRDALMELLNDAEEDEKLTQPMLLQYFVPAKQLAQTLLLKGAEEEEEGEAEDE